MITPQTECLSACYTRAILTCSVRVKWGKRKFDGVEVNTDEPPVLLKSQLFSLSGKRTTSNSRLPRLGFLKI